MAISERARLNHDELFPGHVSTLVVTDPELIEVFDTFAFEEVLAHGVISTRTRLLTQLAAMVASQAVAEFRVMVGAALTAGVTPVEVKEVVYQAVPYVGMAKVFDAIHAANDVLTDRGVQLPLPTQSTTTPDNRMEIGLATQKQVVGADAVEAMYANSPADELHLRRYDGITLVNGGATRNDIIFSMAAGVHYNFRNWIAGTLGYNLAIVQTSYRYMTDGLIDNPSYIRHELVAGVRVAM